MQKQLLKIGSASVAFVLFVVGTSQAQDSPFFRAVTNLNPVGYWPMQETNAPAVSDIETNLGSLGAVANAYYLDLQGASPVTRGITGALAGDSDKAVTFTGANNCYMAVPAISTNLAQAPFTIEFWAWPKGTSLLMPLGKSGYEGLNGGGNVGSGTGLICGWIVDWSRTAKLWDIDLFKGNASGTTGMQTLYGSSLAWSTNSWQHVVFTYDGTTVKFYWNGNYYTSMTASYTPDTWAPLTIGAARIGGGSTGDQGNHNFNGSMDEVAIYTNALSAADIMAHYMAGTNSSPATNYAQLVMADNPMVYYRLDAPAYTAPSPAANPVLTNYGSVPVQGNYPPNTVPGGVSGPNVLGLGSNVVASPMNGLLAAANAGYAPEFNPTNQQPLTAMIWVKGYPTDPRFQCPMGHGDTSWHFGWSLTGVARWSSGTTGGEIMSVKVVNDSNWHFLTGVYDGTTNYLYIDGVLDSMTNTTGTIPGTMTNVFLGGAPDYTNATIERFFAGSICQAAFFTNALTAGQVQQLYSAAGVLPYIVQQPVPAVRDQGDVFINTVQAAGSPPFAYQWFTNGVALLNQTNASLIFNPVQKGNEGNYYVVVSNNVGSVTSVVVSLTVNVKPTIISQYPVAYTNPITLFAGADPTFSVLAGGQLPLHYQWFSNNVAVVGATNASYALANVQAGFTNFCVVTNVGGSATSMVWSVSVIAAPTAPYPQAVLAGDPIGYWRLNESDSPSDGALAHDYCGGDNGIYTNTMLGGPSYNSVTDPSETSASFGAVSFLNCMAWKISGIDFSAPTNVNAEFSVEAWVNGYAQTIDAAIVSKGWGNGGEQFCLDVHGNAFRFFVRQSELNVTPTVYGATSTNQPDGNWHHVVGVCDEAGGTVRLYVDGVRAATASIIPGSGINALGETNLMLIGSRPGGVDQNYNNDQFSGYISDVAVYDYALSDSQVLANYYSAGIAPSITQDVPGSTKVNENGNISITTLTTGTPPLAYQWYDVNLAMAMPGQTNATLALTNVTVSHNYYMVVTNVYGTAQSSTIGVSLNSGAPRVAALPNVYVFSNSVYPYSATATNTEPFFYQWYNSGVPIAGATNKNYAFTAVTNTTITVVVTNVYGAATSSPSMVTIILRPTGAFAQAVLALNPVGYWPMQETNAPAAANIETNRGTLGPVANAYYVDSQGVNPVSRGITGALAGDSDPAVSFNAQPNCYLAVPAISINLAQAPFSIEFWAWPVGTALGVPVSKTGWEGLNAGGNTGAGSGLPCGWMVDWSRNAGLWDIDFFNGVGTSTAGMTTIYGSASAATTNGWQHVVFTYSGTNVEFYWNGQLITNVAVSSAIFMPDTWNPFTMGAARIADNTTGDPGGKRWNGSLDEVALYTNVLSAADIMAHYQAGTNSSPATNYAQLVLADHPMAYYRLDAPAYTAPSPAANPVLINYGSVPVGGNYPPNTIPGGVSGPNILGLGGSNVLASPINGLNAAVDAGYTPEFNPINQPMTAMIWVKGYPTDTRFQSFMSHGDGSWHFALGTTGFAHWSSGNNGGEIASVKLVNDGNWHFLTGVYDGANNYLYIDGALDSTLATGSTMSGSTADVYLGGAPDYTTSANERYFAGSICQAAFYTNALTAVQIQQLYAAASSGGTIPSLSIAPANGKVVVTWNVGTLLSATNVMGPYNPVLGATSPYTNTPSGAQMFYRVSNP